MLREAFAHNLRKLQDEILRTGSEVEDNLLTVVEAFIQRNNRQAQQLIKADEWVNEMRIDIGMKSLQLIATQQPAGQDMRLLAATIEIIGELERIHDYVKGIGKISLKIGDQPLPRELVQFMPMMAEEATSMLHKALEAFSKSDSQLALAIPARDDIVDEYYYRSYKEIMAYGMDKPELLETLNWIEWATHNLERVADRVINICEWVVYMDTAVYQELD